MNDEKDLTTQLEDLKLKITSIVGEENLEKLKTSSNLSIKLSGKVQYSTKSTFIE
ncbi:MAG: hypothetical protein ACTSUE_17800 [Promethearchaeota archaeon]